MDSRAKVPCSAFGTGRGGTYGTDAGPPPPVVCRWGVSKCLPIKDWLLPPAHSRTQAPQLVGVPLSPPWVRAPHGERRASWSS